jgi:hypothetical protein
MLLLPSNVRWLHVEASSRCNAWCPACPRNQNGQGMRPGLIEQDLLVERYKQVLSELPVLDGIQFCGNYGDPVIAQHFLDLVAASVGRTSKIQIHTNGSLRNTAWWHQLASHLQKFDSHDVWFGIDGLAGTHEIYRQATDFHKIIENAQAFIQAGGHATWQFIPFKHNEHQIKDCLLKSQQLGFKKFKLVKSFRSKKTIAFHWKTGEKFELEPADVYTQKWSVPLKNQVKISDCMHLAQPSIYLSASGVLSPCCYLADQLTDISAAEMLLKNNMETILITAPLRSCLENCGSYKHS